MRRRADRCVEQCAPVQEALPVLCEKNSFGARLLVTRAPHRRRITRKRARPSVVHSLRALDLRPIGPASNEESARSVANDANSAVSCGRMLRRGAWSERCTTPRPTACRCCATSGSSGRAPALQATGHVLTLGRSCIPTQESIHSVNYYFITQVHSDLGRNNGGPHRLLRIDSSCRSSSLLREEVRDELPHLPHGLSGAESVR